MEKENANNPLFQEIGRLTKRLRAARKRHLEKTKLCHKAQWGEDRPKFSSIEAVRRYCIANSGADGCKVCGAGKALRSEYVLPENIEIVSFL